MVDEVAVLAIRQKIEKLREENEKLLRQLHDVYHERQTVKEATSKGPEIGFLRDLFHAFDLDKDGFLNDTDLKSMQFALGDPLPDSQVAELLAVIEGKSSQKRKKATITQFVDWLQSDKKRCDRYVNRYKVYSVKSREPVDVRRVRVRHVGRSGTLEYRLAFEHADKDGNYSTISPWHDIPLVHSVDSKSQPVAFNMVVEIPKWTRAKFEISTTEMMNPIRQDTKKGQLRFYQHGDMMFNYGALPQTWEDPEHITEDTGRPGDNDPLDVLEIGYRQLRTGDIVPVKILGVLALIDSGETDWKLIVIALSDPLADKLNNIDDVEREMPGAVEAIREYLRVYKVCTGAPENEYAFGGKAMDKEYATKVVMETHSFWKKLRAKNQIGTVSKL